MRTLGQKAGIRFFGLFCSFCKLNKQFSAKKVDQDWSGKHHFPRNVCKIHDFLISYYKTFNFIVKTTHKNCFSKDCKEELSQKNISNFISNRNWEQFLERLETTIENFSIGWTKPSLDYIQTKKVIKFLNRFWTK